MVVSLRGEHDLSTAPGFAEALAGATSASAGDVVVDLSGVVFMDAAIIRVLVGGRADLGLESRLLSVRAPSPFARRVLGLCGLLGFVDPVSALAAGGVGSCVTVRGTWSRAPRHHRSVQVLPRLASAVATSVPVARLG